MTGRLRALGLLRFSVRWSLKAGFGSNFGLLAWSVLSGCDSTISFSERGTKVLSFQARFAFLQAHAG